MTDGFPNFMSRVKDSLDYSLRGYDDISQVDDREEFADRASTVASLAKTLYPEDISAQTNFVNQIIGLSETAIEASQE